MSAAEDNEAYEDSTITIKTADGRLLQVVAYLTIDGEEIAVADTVPIDIPVTAEDMLDPGRVILELTVRECIRRLKNAPWDMKAADLEFIRKLSQDNSVTLAQVRRGDFGSVAARVAEEFALPFPVKDETPTPPKVSH